MGLISQADVLARQAKNDVTRKKRDDKREAQQAADKAKKFGAKDAERAAKDAKSKALIARIQSDKAKGIDTAAALRTEKAATAKKQEQTLRAEFTKDTPAGTVVRSDGSVTQATGAEAEKRGFAPSATATAKRTGGGNLQIRPGTSNFDKIRDDFLSGKTSIGQANEAKIKEDFLSGKTSQQQANSAAITTFKQADGSFSTERPEPQRGFGNILPTLNAALNPFAKSSVIATTDSRVFNTAAEYVANNPLITAAILTGGAGLVRGGANLLSKGLTKAGLGQLKPTSIISTKTVFNPITNKPATTKLAKQTAGILAGPMAKLGKKAAVFSIVAGTVGTYPFAEWSRLEALDTMNFAYKEAIKTDDPAFIAEIQEQFNDVYDRTLWESIASKIPYANIVTGFNDKYNAIDAQRKVNDKIAADRIQQIQSGESEDQKWDRVRQEEFDNQKAIVDYYNNQRTQADTFARESKIAAQAQDTEFFDNARQERVAQDQADRERDLARLQEDAAFFAAQRDEKRVAEINAQIEDRERELAIRAEDTAFFDSIKNKSSDSSSSTTSKSSSKKSTAALNVENDFLTGRSSQPQANQRGLNISEPPTQTSAPPTGGSQLNTTPPTGAGSVSTTAGIAPTQPTTGVSPGQVPSPGFFPVQNPSPTMQEEAAFWTEYRNNLRKQEEADRIATAEFWINYRKTSAKMAQNDRPSNLNFGLL